MKESMSLFTGVLLVVAIPATTLADPSRGQGAMEAWLRDTAEAVFDGMGVHAWSHKLVVTWGGPTYIRGEDSAVCIGLPRTRDPVLFEAAVTLLLAHEAAHHVLFERDDVLVDGKSEELFCTGAAVVYLLANPRVAAALASHPDRGRLLEVASVLRVPHRDAAAMVADLVEVILGERHGDQTATRWDPTALANVFWRHLPRLMWASPKSTTRRYLMDLAGIRTEPSEDGLADAGTVPAM